MVLCNGFHRVAAQTFRHAEAGETAGLQAIRAASLRAEPNGARAILEHGSHANVLQPEPRCHVFELAVCVARETGIGAEPQAAVARRRDAPSEVAGQTFRRAVWNELAGVQAFEPSAEGAEPQTPFGILQQRAHVVARAVAHVEPAWSIGAQPQHAGARCRDPKIAVAIAQDRTHGRAEILRAGERLELTVAPAEQTTVLGADPKRAVVVFEHRAHGIGPGAGSDLDLLETIRGAAIQAADIGSGPNGAVVADLQCADRRVVETLLASVGAHARAGDFEQCLVGADPDVAAVVGDDGADVAVTQSRLLVRLELSGRERQHTDAGADPQTPVVIDMQSSDDARAQLRRVAAIENSEAHAVEAHETFVSRQPQIAIRRAGEGFDRVLRQALLDLPVVEHVLADGELRIERVGGPGSRE